MDVLQIVIQWLHVLGAIFWFGGTLFMNFVIIPGLRNMSAGAQQEFGVAVGKTARIVMPIAYVTIALGVLRGTVWGPIKGFDVLFGTAYGWTWLFALVVAISLIGYGQMVLEPFRERIQHASPDQAPLLIRKAAALFGFELLMFFAIFTAMILMRFGL